MGIEEERARVRCFGAESGEMGREEEGGRVMSISWGLRKCNHAAPAAHGGGGSGEAGVGMSKRPKIDAQAAPVTGNCVMAEPGKGAEKKKKKLVTVPLSQDKVDRLLSLHKCTRPFPVMSEEQLAVISDPVKREELREAMARAAKNYYLSREQIKREQDLIREEIKTLGYAKGVMEVTDDEEEADDN